LYLILILTTYYEGRHYHWAKKWEV